MTLYTCQNQQKKEIIRNLLLHWKIMLHSTILLKRLADVIVSNYKQRIPQYNTENRNKYESNIEHIVKIIIKNNVIRLI